MGVAAPCQQQPRMQLADKGRLDLSTNSWRRAASCLRDFDGSRLRQGRVIQVRHVGQNLL